MKEACNLLGLPTTTPLHTVYVTSKFLNMKPFISNYLIVFFNKFHENSLRSCHTILVKAAHTPPLPHTPHTPPLPHTSLQAGCTALQPLRTLKQAMQERQCFVIWNVKDELPVSLICSPFLLSQTHPRKHPTSPPHLHKHPTSPPRPHNHSTSPPHSPLKIEIDLGPDSTFHSIFACPILRQQTTEANPPLRLLCGHVISKDAFNKLISAEKWLQVSSITQK